MLNATAMFQIGQIVRHRKYGFRGVIFDVDPEFANTEEWYESKTDPWEQRNIIDQIRVFRKNELLDLSHASSIVCGI